MGSLMYVGRVISSNIFNIHDKRKKLKYWINLFNKPPGRTKFAPKLILTAGRREREISENFERK